MAGLNRSSSAPMRNLFPPQELLDDLCSRFVLNVPKEDLESFERILFLLEQAHWFYEDNSVEQNPSLKSLSFKEFTSLMFNSCAALRPYIAHIDDIYKDFTSYKFRVPVTGAIILDESYERVFPFNSPELNFSKYFANLAVAIALMSDELGIPYLDLSPRKIELHHMC